MKGKLFLVGLMLMSTSLVAQADPITLNLASPMRAGSGFDVLVQVENAFHGRPAGDLLVAFGFNVAVGDDAVVQYTGETPGSLFTDLSGFPGGPAVAGFAANPAGIGPSDFTGPLTLATLHFNALAPGTTAIGVTWDASDLNQGLIYAFLPTGAIAASTVVSTLPVPGTLLLLLSGLALLIIDRLSVRSRDPQRADTRLLKRALHLLGCHGY